MFNMFIMRYEYFIDYCSWLFDILFILEERLEKKERIYRYNMEVKDANKYYLKVGEEEKSKNIQKLIIKFNIRRGKKPSHF